MQLFRNFPDVLHTSEGTSRYQPTGGNAPNQNTGGDPFTGTSRYQPPVNTSAPPHTGGGDPFTGASRYQTSLPPSGPTQSGHSDPFTGANRYQPSPSPGFTVAPPSPTPSTPSSGNVIPHVRQSISCQVEPINRFRIQKAPIKFELCNIPAMRTKLTELNNEVQKEIVWCP